MLMNAQWPKLTFPHAWNDILIYVERLVQAMESQKVTWFKLRQGYMKLNTDGCSCSKGNPGSSGGGGILRDHFCALIFACADYYGHADTNTC